MPSTTYSETTALCIRSMDLMTEGTREDFEPVYHPEAVNREAAVEPPANPPPADAAPIAASKPAPALKPAGDPVSPEAKSDRTMGLGGWVLFGIVVVALFGGITLVRRRRATVRHRSITDFSPTTAELELQPALARRP